jgi:putative addiction module killer protein
MRDDRGPADRRFCCWFAELRDRQARARITVRIRRLSFGKSETRIDYGPGYRVYFVQRGDRVCVLLCGGDKRSQDRDIELAQEM